MRAATAHPEIGNDTPMCFEWENFIEEYWKKHRGDPMVWQHLKK
jgi:hypothetical protein